MKKKSFAGFLLMLVMLFGLSQEATYAQDLTQRMDWVCKNEPMPSVFKNLEQVSGFKILITYDELQDYKVTVNLKSQTGEKIIQGIIGSYPLTY